MGPEKLKAVRFAAGLLAGLVTPIGLFVIACVIAASVSGCAFPERVTCPLCGRAAQCVSVRGKRKEYRDSKHKVVMTWQTNRYGSNGYWEIESAEDLTAEALDAR